MSPSPGWPIRNRRFPPPDAYVRIVGGEPRSATGSGVAEGVALPGFAIVEVAEGRLLRLAGRHRFSRYELAFSLDRETVLAATSLVEFPGIGGRLYRALVVGSRGARVSRPAFAS